MKIGVTPCLGQIINYVIINTVKSTGYRATIFWVYNLFKNKMMNREVSFKDQQKQLKREKIFQKYFNEHHFCKKTCQKKFIERS